MSQGYFSHPTVFGDRIIFVSEDDLWSVSTEGGEARRLTSGLGEMSKPLFSREGQFVAFSAEEEGHREVYIMNSEGGEIKRLTYLGGITHPTCWDYEGNLIVTSDAPSPQRATELFKIPIEGGIHTPLNIGPASNLDIHPEGWMILERNSYRPDPAHWKRYRGGTAGKLWLSNDIESNFKAYLKDVDTNFSRPLWVGDKVYFLSDHEGVGNVYSSSRTGRNLKRHTALTKYYARNMTSDGQSIVFHSGGDIYLYDIDSEKLNKVEIEYHSQRTQRQRKYVESTNHFENYKLHPKGHKLSITSRGQVFTMGNWEGPITKHGDQPDVRYRFGEWLKDENRIVQVNDEEGEEFLEIYPEDGKSESIRLSDIDIGIVRTMKASPTEDKVAIYNNRNELLIIDLKTQKRTLIDQNKHGGNVSFNWSPDGNWVAFSNNLTHSHGSLFLFDIKKKSIHQVTRPMLFDFEPCFSADGKYLYFLSQRVLDPVYDEAQFELSFTKTSIPCLITLQKETTSPFLPQPTLEDEVKDGDDKKKSPKTKLVVKIDLEGIRERVLSFPVKPDRYQALSAAPGKVFWTKEPVKGALSMNWLPGQPSSEATLEVFDFKTQECESLMSGISNFQLSSDQKWMAIRSGNKLRVLKAGEKTDSKTDGKSGFNRKNGKINMNRIQVLIEPALEWKQMLNEAWRLQRDHFWHENMGRIDWDEVMLRYEPLLERVNTRKEFSDLAWEVQGELGTSHCYEIGGDYRTKPFYPMGFLGADFKWDAKNNGFKILKVLNGDSWDSKNSSPLASPGINAKIGDTLIEIDTVELTRDFSPQEALFHKAGAEVQIKLLRRGEKTAKYFVVKTLNNETILRYRDWVNFNAEYVHKKSNGKIGYIHIPDMGAFGFAEFHRHFLQEYDRDAMIVDIRYNGGGHVSQLLLEKIARKRNGMCESRWFGNSAVPDEAPAGPITAITNEYAGSDGDIFSHTFKMKDLGPLIGKRTWGGVVGIWPRHILADGTVTTQPEFSHWYEDVGWDVENYGTDPTIDVDFAPQDYRNGVDPQMDRALAETQKLMRKQPAYRPQPKDRPDLTF